PPTTHHYTLSLHDALPIWRVRHSLRRVRLPHSHGCRERKSNDDNCRAPLLPLPVWREVRETPAFRASYKAGGNEGGRGTDFPARSEEHTSELQSRFDLVCR